MNKLIHLVGNYVPDLDIISSWVLKNWEMNSMYWKVCNRCRNCCSSLYVKMMLGWLFPNLGLVFVLMLRPFIPELVMSTDLLSFEHSSVLLFCFLRVYTRKLCVINHHCINIVFLCCINWSRMGRYFDQFSYKCAIIKKKIQTDFSAYLLNSHSSDIDDFTIFQSWNSLCNVIIFFNSFIFVCFLGVFLSLLHFSNNTLHVEEFNDHCANC